VPPAAGTGPVTVSAGGNTSAGFPFTVITTGTLSGGITRATGGAALAGATVQAVLVGVVKGTAASAANGTYSIPNLDAGIYDVRVSASGFSSEVRSGTVVSANATTTVNVAMLAPGSIAGRVTQADGVTPIAGAAVSAYAGPAQKGSASTNATGDYTIAGLHVGSYTVQAANVGHRTKEQGATVAENTTTTSNFTLDPAASGPVLYAYDGLGRLIQVTDPSGDAAFYHYDAVGNITAIDRVGSGTTVAISGVTPVSGATGTSVAIYGAGFGATQGTSTVRFNATTATATSWSTTAITATVPAGATTGPIVVVVNGQSSNGVTFSVTAAAAGPPTISGFSPTLVATGDTITVSGTNFDTTPANNRLTTNLAAAQVTTAAPTSLQATVPVTTTGRVIVATPNGTASSTTYLWVTPPSYATANVDSTGSITVGTATPIAVNTAGKFALRAFEGIQGHRASISLANGTFAAGGAVAIYGVHADPHPAGFGSIGFLEPVDLNATGTYTLLLAPNSGTGSATVTVYDVPADVTGPIVPGVSNSVPVHISTAGQNARLAFSGTAGARASVGSDTTTTIPSGRLKVLRPDGTTLGDVGFIPNFAAFLDPVTLDTTGTYTFLVDPDTTNTGDIRVTLYDVPADTNGTITINGGSVPVSLAPGQKGFLTFSGTQNQQVTVRVTGNTIGLVTVKLLYIDGQNQTQLAQALSSAASFNLAQATLPTPGTATYTISIDPSGANTGTLSVSVTSP
jgi:YD repeat-containing protein